MCELFQDSWDSYLGAYILDFCPPEPHCGREWSISQTATDVDAPPRRRQRRMNREKTDPKDRIQSALVAEVAVAGRIAAAPTISSSSRSSSIVRIQQPPTQNIYPIRGGLPNMNLSVLRIWRKNILYGNSEDKMSG